MRERAAYSLFCQKRERENVKTLASLGKKTEQNNEDFIYYGHIQNQLL